MAPHMPTLAGALTSLLLLPLSLANPIEFLDARSSNSSSVPRDSIPNDTYQRVVNSRCTPAQVLAERVAWAEAGLLANAFNKWVPEKTYQEAMDMYMGSDSIEKGGWFSGTNYRKRVQNAVSNEYKLHTGGKGWADDSITTYVYCDEQDSKSDLCKGTVGAYEWDSLGNIWTNHYIVLCPFFFETVTLSEQIRQINQDRSMATYLDNAYWNQGGIYFHETFHMEQTITNPRALDTAYGPSLVYQEALEKNTAASSVNADSYTMAATAMFLQQTYGLNFPPVPKNIPNNNAPAWTGPTTLAIDPPNGWVNPQDVNSASSKPDANVWKATTPYTLNMADYAPPADPTPVCYGTPNTPSAQRDYVKDVIMNQYCPYMGSTKNGIPTAAGITISKKLPYGPVGYATETNQPQNLDQALWLSVSIVPTDACAAGFQVDTNVCEHALMIALDGCNTDSTAKKFGGTVTIGCGIYDMQLTSGKGDTPPKGFAAENGS